MKKQASKKPAPDAKAVTRNILTQVALFVEEGATWLDLLGQLPSAGTTKEEWAALQEARALAVAYIRKGATL
jgi:hypothetical protein